MRTFDEYKVQRYGKDLILNLGCGHTNLENYYGIDIAESTGVDMVADLLLGIPLETGCLDAVVARDILEHFPPGQPNIKIMEEIHRVLKIGGKLKVEVPSTDGCNIAAFQDPTHLSFWNQKKFQYFMADEYGENFRALYDIKCHFKPLELVTVNNRWGITYVHGLFEKTRD